MYELKPLTYRALFKDIGYSPTVRLRPGKAPRWVEGLPPNIRRKCELNTNVELPVNPGLNQRLYLTHTVPQAHRVAQSTLRLLQRRTGRSELSVSLTKVDLYTALVFMSLYFEIYATRPCASKILKALTRMNCPPGLMPKLRTVDDPGNPVTCRFKLREPACSTIRTFLRRMTDPQFIKRLLEEG